MKLFKLLVLVVLFQNLAITSSYGQNTINGNTNPVKDVAYTYSYEGIMEQGSYIEWSVSNENNLPVVENNHTMSITFTSTGSKTITAKAYDFNGFLRGTYTLYVSVAPWTVVNTNEVYHLGNVGIGNTDPSEKLDVTGNARFTGDIKAEGTKYFGDNKSVIQFSDTWLRLNPDNNFSNGTYTSGLFRADGGLQTGANINSTQNYIGLMKGVRADDNSYEWVGYYSGEKRQGIILYDGAWGGANNLTNEFSISAENSNKLTLNTQGEDIALMPKAGNVGIGTTSPSQKLDVIGNAEINGTIYTNSHGNSANWNAAHSWGNHASSGYYKLGTNLNMNNKSISGLDLSGGGISGVNYNISGVNQLSINDPGEGINFHNNGFIYLVDDNATNDKFYIGPGNVGIGMTPNASFKLDVNGTIRATSGNSSQWNEAYSQRGSVIAGTGLDWSNGKLNVNSSSIITGTSQWNADGDGSVLTYNDGNPTYNTKYVGAIINIKGDNVIDNALVRSGAFHAHHFQASNGIYIGNAETNGARIIDASGNITALGTVSATGGNSTEWNTAHGWGNHASAGYYKSGNNPSFGNISTTGNITGKSVNASYSNLYKFGGIYFTWDSDSYGTNTHHSIRSTYGDAYGDHLTMNSFGHMRFNFDSNSNGNNVFQIGHATTGTGNTLFHLNESGQLGLGTTSPTSGYKLDVNGATSSRGLIIPARYDFGNNESAIEMGIGTNSYNAIRGYNGTQHIGTIHFFDDTWDSGNASGSAGSINLSPLTAVTIGPWNNPVAYFRNSDGHVGIGIETPSEKLHINGSVRGNQDGALRISTGHGYIDIGPKGSSHAHFYTDRSNYYFNKRLRVDEGIITSHNENLQLQTSGTTRVTFNNSSGESIFTARINAPGGNSTNWNTAHAQRGEAIAGSGLTWNGSELDVTNVNTDDQTATEVNFDPNTSNLTSGTVQAVIEEVNAKVESKQGSRWTDTAGDISYLGNVSIGTNGSSAKLDIVGSATGDSYMNSPTLKVSAGSISGRVAMWLETESNDAADLVFRNNGIGRVWFSSRASSENHDFRIYTNPDETGGPEIMAMSLAQNGNVGFGTTATSNGILTVANSSATSLLRLENNGAGNDASMRFRAKSTSGDLLHGDISLYATGSSQGFLGFKVPYDNISNSGYDMIIDHNGNVGIGMSKVDGNYKLANGYKLSVAGNAVMEEVNILFEGEWPDYVFNSKYNLMSLNETKDYIEENKHLPNVPSAKEVKEEGIKVGAMNALLLQKIEELTLHLIKQNEQIESLQNRLEIVESNK